MIVIGKGNSAKALREKLGNLPRVEVVDGQVRQRMVVQMLRNGLARRDWVRLGLDDHQPVVCWGVHLPRRPAGPVLNGTIIMDKFDQLREFREANIPIPTVALRVGEGREVVTFAPPGDHDGSWLARRRHHRGGHDILGPMDFNELRGILRARPGYGVKYIDKTHEWRVHTFQGRVLRLARKVPNEGAEQVVAWNQDTSHFKYDIRPGPETLRQLTTLGTSAVAALGMDFGAVDVIKDRGGQFYVLEVNSAPGISDNANTLDAYVQAMRGWADEGRIRNTNPE